MEKTVDEQWLDFLVGTNGKEWQSTDGNVLKFYTYFEKPHLVMDIDGKEISGQYTVENKRIVMLDGGEQFPIVHLDPGKDLHSITLANKKGEVTIFAHFPDIRIPTDPIN